MRILGIEIPWLRKEQASLFDMPTPTAPAPPKPKPKNLGLAGVTFGAKKPAAPAATPKGPKVTGVSNLFSQPKSEPKIGDTKSEGGTVYIFLETTIGKPRWHRKKELEEMKEHGETIPAIALEKFPDLKGEAERKPAQGPNIERIEKPQSVYGVKNVPRYDHVRHRNTQEFFVYHDGGKLEKVMAIDAKEARQLFLEKFGKESKNSNTTIKPGNEKKEPAKKKEEPNAELKYLKDHINESDLKATGEESIEDAYNRYKEWQKDHGNATPPASGGRLIQNYLESFKHEGGKTEPSTEDELSDKINKEVQREQEREKKLKARVQDSEPDLFSAPPPEEKPKDDFGVSADIIGLRKQREEWNRQALAILEKPNDKITDEDKKILAKYSGNGGTDEGSLNEFYTSKEVANFMWEAVKKLGFKGGSVLEPSCGTGVFIHTRPNDAVMMGVELSPVSARIAQILHPENEIQNSPFEKFAKENRDLFDGFIGNIPFGVRGVSAVEHKPDLASCEQYFTDTLLDQIKGGAVGAVIVPTGLMDNKSLSDFRHQLSDKGEFLGALRLPNTAFKHAGTSVTSDIVFFKRHPKAIEDALMDMDEPEAAKARRAAGFYDEDFVKGDYFTGEGKANVLGEVTTGQWGRMAVKGQLTEEKLSQALNDVGNWKSKLDYDKVIPSYKENLANLKQILPIERELHEGDRRVINGKVYILNKNHRWEREETPEEERARKLNIDFVKMGVGTREQFHQQLGDVAYRIKLDGEKRRAAIDYLQYADREQFPKADAIRDTLIEADRLAVDAAGPDEADKLALASLLGGEIDRLQAMALAGQLADSHEFEQLVLLLDEYKQKYGNPGRDKKLVRMGMKYKGIAKLLGAITEDGQPSDFMLNPEKYVRTKAGRMEYYDLKRIPDVMRYMENAGLEGTVRDIARYWKESKGKSDDELEKILLQDETVGFDHGKFVPVNNVTTGSVYDKLDRWASEIAAIGDSKEKNAQLKKKKFEWQADQVRKAAQFRTIEEMKDLNVGSRWVPIEITNEFMKSEGLKPLIFDTAKNAYEVDYSTGEGEAPAFHNMYGSLIRHINNLGLEHAGDNKMYYDRIDEFNEKYRAWVAVHPRRAELEDMFNRKFNDFIEEKYDDTPIQIDKMADGFDLNRYHYAAMRYLLKNGKGILAYDVGLGKTFCSLATALYREQLGEVKKPVAVVPKSVLANWKSELDTLTKGKNVRAMVIGVTSILDAQGNQMFDDKGKPRFKDDSFDEVQKKLQQVAQNPYDMTIISRDWVDRMLLDKAKASEYLEDIITKHIKRSNVDEESVTFSPKKKKGGKFKFDEKKAEDALRQKIMGRYAGGAREKMLNLTFEQIGFDMMIVDEMHNYRKLFGLTGRPIKWALQQPDTMRSMTMYFLSRYLREQNGGKNVYGLTATPVVNNPLEVFNMLQYTAPEEWDKRNMTNVRDFFGHFGRSETVRFPKTDGTWEDTEGLTGFQNLKELAQTFYKNVYFKKAKDVGLKLPQGDDKELYSDMVGVQKRVYGELREGAKALLAGNEEELAGEGEGGLSEEKKDHIFSILSDMQKATISLDLLRRTGSPFAPVLSEDEVKKFGPTAKMKHYVGEAKRLYDSGKKHLLFCHFIEAQDEIKKNLVAAGIPENEIGIVNSKTVGTAQKRLEIANDYNAGKYKILIGNSTMAEGMNLQKGTGAVYRISLPWTPSAIQQENGRGLRQGNTETNVELGSFMTRGSFDQILKSTLKRKESWLDPLMTGKVDEAANLDSGMIFDPYEIEIALSDDPDAAKLRAEIAKKEAEGAAIKAEKNKALATFNQYQNIIIQYNRLSDEEKAGEMGKTAMRRINMMKQSLANNDSFEHKSLLDGFKPAYIQSKTGTIIPQGSYVSGLDGNWKERGVWKIMDVDPVGRTLKIKKVFLPGEEQDHYNDPLGVEQEIDYNEVVKHFTFGMAAVTPPEDEMQGETLKKIKKFSQVNAFTPDFISAHKDDIMKQLAEDTSNRMEKVPVINKKTGKLDLEYFEEISPPSKYMVEHAEDEEKRGHKGFYTKELEKQLAKYERITSGEIEPYWPIDYDRWKEDILAEAMKVAKKEKENWKAYHRTGYREPRGWEKLAQDIWGWKWENVARQVLKDKPELIEEEKEVEEVEE